MTPHAKGLGLGYVSLVLMGFGITVIQVTPLHPATLVFYRCVVAAPLLWLLMAARGTSQSILPHDRSKMLAVGILTGAHWITLFISMRLSTVALGMISFYTFPVFATLIEAAVQKRKPRGVDLVMAVLMLAGVSLLTPITNASPEMLPAVLVGILSAVLWAGRLVLIHHSLRAYPGECVMFWNLVVVGAILLPAAFLDAGPLHWSMETFLKVAFLGLFVTGLCHTLLLMSLRHISATLLSQIGPIQVVAAALAGWALIGEPLTFRIVFGGALVSLAGFAASWTHREKRRPPNPGHRCHIPGEGGQSTE